MNKYHATAALQQMLLCAMAVQRRGEGSVLRRVGKSLHRRESEQRSKGCTGVLQQMWREASKAEEKA